MSEAGEGGTAAAVMPRGPSPLLPDQGSNRVSEAGEGGTATVMSRGLSQMQLLEQGNHRVGVTQLRAGPESRTLRVQMAIDSN